LLTVTVWLWRTRNAWWVWIVTGIPTVWMYIMSTWALSRMTYTALKASFPPEGFRFDPVPWVGIVLIVLALLMLLEAILIVFGSGGSSKPRPELAGAVAAG
jgi:carbon starvation protein